MDLKARVDVNFARVDVNLQTVTVTQFCYNFFFILIPSNIKVLLILHTKFQPNIPSHFGEMDLNVRVVVNSFRVNVNLQTTIVTQFRHRFFFILLSVNIKVLLILYTKFQPNIPNHSGENDDFISFAICINGSHLEFSTRLNFTILKPWSLIMLHMKFKIHGCSGLRE